MNFVNLTPHNIVFRMADGTDIVFPPDRAGPARVGTITVPVSEIDGMTVVENVWGALEGLPGPEEGTVYIVSLAVIRYVERAGYAAIDRVRSVGVIHDIIAPDTSPTGGAVRWRLGDEDPEGLDGAPIPSARVGQVRAVTSWVRPRA